MIKVIIADDHSGMREAWRFILGLQEDIHVLAVCSSGQEVVEFCRQSQTDVVLMDINMAPVTGFEATRLLLKENPALKIIGISIHSEPSYVQQMIKIGGRGFITKSSSSDEMIMGIKEAVSGNIYICQEVRSRMNLIS